MTDYVSATDVLRRGGTWLAAARGWVKRHCRNGERVTWSSPDVLEPSLRVQDVEDLAAEVAAAVMNELRADREAEEAARTAAEAVRAALAEENQRLRAAAEATRAATRSAMAVLRSGGVLDLQHEPGRYTGDGDPGCVGGCLRCVVEQLRRAIDG